MPAISSSRARLLLARLSFVTVLFAVSGCSYFFGESGWFPDRSADYLKAEESPPLQVPDEIGVALEGGNYRIPELQYANVLPSQYEVPRITPLQETTGKGSVAIQRFRNNQWVLVKRSPGQTWPLVLQFLQSNQVPLLKMDAEQGLIETDWLSVSGAARLGRGGGGDDQLPDERYQFQLKAGVQRNTTEVLVRQLDKTAAQVPSGLWQESSSTERRENMVNLLAEHLARSPDQSSHSLLAQGIGSASKVDMRYSADGAPYLALQLPFDRGWASLQLALGKVDMKVRDLNRSEGIFYVTEGKGDRSKKRGRLARLFGAGDKKEKNSGQQYIIRMAGQSDYQAISIARDGEPALRANEQAFLLKKILVKLS